MAKPNKIDKDEEVKIAMSADDVPGMSGRKAGVIEKFNLPENYRIQIDRPVSELSSSFSRAFEVSDSKQKNGIYAIILPNTLPIRFRIVQKLKEYFNVNFSNIVDAGFTEAGGGQYGSYAVVVERPRGLSIPEHIKRLKIAGKVIANPKTDMFIPEEIIAREIIAPINEILRNFEDNGICHGSINFRNVYLENLEFGKGKLVLGECISEPCGFSQLHQFEPVGRAMCQPLGKGEGDVKNDYFALGALALYCMFGDIPGRAVEQEEFITSRLTKGSYNTYVGSLDLSPRITDLLRGLLNDNPLERWGYDQVSQWIKGKQYNLIRPTIRKEAIRAFEFKDIMHTNRKSLAHSFYQSWEESTPHLRDKKIVKWLELSVNNLDAADEMSSLIITTGGENSKSRREDDELIAKTLILLDPDSPVRFKKIAANIDGLGPLLTNAWLQQNHTELQTIAEIFRMNLPDYKAAKDVDNDKSDRWVLQKINTFIKISAFGFGLERCIYDLNSGLPCQSNLLQKQFIVDLAQLLYFLNDNASKLSGYDPVDRHIAAFIASKLELGGEISFKQARRFKDSDTKLLLIKLALLAFAQKKSGALKLSNLATWMAARLEPISDAIYSKKIREDFQKEMSKVSKTGNIDAMLQLIINSDYFSRDAEGLMDARNKYRILDYELRKIGESRRASLRTNSHYMFGLYVAKILSVMVFLGVLTTVL